MEVGAIIGRARFGAVRLDALADEAGALSAALAEGEEFHPVLFGVDEVQDFFLEPLQVGGGEGGLEDRFLHARSVGLHFFRHPL